MGLSEVIEKVGPVAVWRQGEQYIAATLSRRGNIQRPTWGTHPTPEAALDALVSEGEQPEPSVSVDGNPI